VGSVCGPATRCLLVAVVVYSGAQGELVQERLHVGLEGCAPSMLVGLVAAEHIARISLLQTPAKPGTPSSPAVSLSA
jgi:hypothetical protein